MSDLTRHKPRPNPSPTLTGLVIIYMLVFSGLALSQGNSEFILYSLAMVVFISLTMLMHLRVRFSPLTLWLLAFWGLLHMCGGTISIDPSLTDPFRAATNPDDRPTSAVLYALRLSPNLPRYDQFVHTLGFFAATMACYQAVRVLLCAKRSIPLAVVSVLMGIGLGAINEIIEFIAVLSIPDTNVGGYTNTAWDLVANAIGATAAGCYCLARKL